MLSLDVTVGCWVNSTFPCIKAFVSYENSNSSAIHGELFRTYEEGKDNSYSCSAYECRDRDELFEYINALKDKSIFTRYYQMAILNMLRWKLVIQRN